jgi:hypothetical protein
LKKNPRQLEAEPIRHRPRAAGLDPSAGRRRALPEKTAAKFFFKLCIFFFTFDFRCAKNNLRFHKVVVSNTIVELMELENISSRAGQLQPAELLSEMLSVPRQRVFSGFFIFAADSGRRRRCSIMPDQATLF